MERDPDLTFNMKIIYEQAMVPYGIVSFNNGIIERHDHLLPERKQS